MTYPVPTPAQLADLQAAEIEERLRIDRTGNPRFVDARSPASVLGSLARANALALYGTHAHLAWIARQIFPDTCDDDEFLARHGSIWGVPRRAAVAAVGQVTFMGAPGATLPAGIALVLGQTRWTTGAGRRSSRRHGDRAGDGRRARRGRQRRGRDETGARLPDRHALGAGGDGGRRRHLRGADVRKPRRLARPHHRPHPRAGHGGAEHDYERWRRRPSPRRASPSAGPWVGPGSVGVLFAMANADGTLRVPTSAEIDTLDAHLQAQAPVTAEVITLGCTLLPVAVTVEVSPDRQSVREAVAAAVAAWLSGPDVAIGEPLRLSRLSEAVSAAPARRGTASSRPPPTWCRRPPSCRCPASSP